MAIPPGAQLNLPNDDPTDGQLEAYALIAGDENKVVLLQAADCDCNEVEERERQAEEKVEYTLPAAEALYTLIRLYMRGRLPPLPGDPLPLYPLCHEAKYDRSSSRHESRGLRCGAS